MGPRLTNYLPERLATSSIRIRYDEFNSHFLSEAHKERLAANSSLARYDEFNYQVLSEI